MPHKDQILWTSGPCYCSFILVKNTETMPSKYCCESVSWLWKLLLLKMTAVTSHLWIEHSIYTYCRMTVLMLPWQSCGQTCPQRFFPDSQGLWNDISLFFLFFFALDNLWHILEFVSIALYKACCLLLTQYLRAIASQRYVLAKISIFIFVER